MDETPPAGSRQRPEEDAAAAESPAVLVTGASRGIGRAVALRLAAAQSMPPPARTVIVHYLENDRAAGEVASRIAQCSGGKCRAITLKANLLFPEEITALFSRIRSEGILLTGLVHCAALTAFKPLLETKPNQWDLTMNVNARGFLLCVQQAVTLMGGGGSIVAISSLGSRRVLPNYGAMGVTKAALESAARYLAAELAPRGIRVNCVTGGLVDTDGIRKFPGVEALIAETTRRTPMRRLGMPEDIAEAVAFLLSPASGWICGQTLVADGGISLY